MGQIVLVVPVGQQPTGINWQREQTRARNHFREAFSRRRDIWSWIDAAKVVQPVASAADRIFKLDHGDSFKPISAIAYRKKFSSRSDSPLEYQHFEKSGVTDKKNRNISNERQNYK